jgi:PKHD-type hydroxylase
MILCIGGVLTEKELAAARDRAAAGAFVDGRLTAGWAANEVKNNTQLAADDPAYDVLSATITTALGRNEMLAAFAWPRAMTRLLFSRSGVGMGYGRHVDNAIMGSPPVRTDLAFTVFLNAPTDYEGGALVIEDAQGEQDIKLEAGSAVLYPATTTHSVAEVTAGVRLVAVGWIQSLVRDPRVREMLFDLDSAKREIFSAAGKTTAFDAVAKVQSNLLRLHAET